MKRRPSRLAIAAVVLVPAFCTIALLAFGYRGPEAGAARSAVDWVDAAVRLGTRNVVSAIYLNVRLFDTLLEVLVFSVAVLGVHFYLTARGEAEKVESIPESGVVRVAADVLMPLILLVGAYVTVYGHLSPGGGFSGGVIAATGLLLTALAIGTRAVTDRVGHRFLDRLEWVALLGILVVAVLPALLGRSPLVELLPPGTPGRLGSSGSTLLYNALIGIKVFAGSWIIVRHFVDHRGEI